MCDPVIPGYFSREQTSYVWLSRHVSIFFSNAREVKSSQLPLLTARNSGIQCNSSF